MYNLIDIYQEKTHVVFDISGIKLKIKIKELEFFKHKKYEPKIKKYKYVHLMNNGLHSINIINFINKHFNNDEHCFIFPCVMLYKTQEKLNGTQNIFYCPLNNININAVDKIIIHGLMDVNLVRSLYKYKKLLQKTYWFIWGGDLYCAPKGKKDDYVRKNIAGILTSFDREIYEDKYGACKKYFDVTYPHDMTEEMLDGKEYKTEDYTHIQINNSTDETTLEMLDILSKFKDEKIKITTILSYTSKGHSNKQLEIMKKGYEIFGNKFNPIIEFMSKEDYAKHLASVDIYISNQNRQQGNGNATFIHSLGGKVFLKNNTSVYKKYNSIGIKIFDTYEISNMNFEEFCAFDEDEKQESIAILKERMKDETKIKQWSDFFNA